MKDTYSITEQIKTAEAELDALEKRKAELQRSILHLKKSQAPSSTTNYQIDQNIVSSISNGSPERDKVALFRSLFRGREDVFPKRYESRRTGKSGYQPVCRNEWVKPLCGKPATKCADCKNRAFVFVTDQVIRNHLIGYDPHDIYRRNFTVGVYPMLLDETCWFLAVDFDKEAWNENAKVYLETCRAFDVPAALERSRSGNGGHIWIFFFEPVPAKVARQLGAFMLTQAMEKRPEMGFKSYDRLFPSQDTLPTGGFGNLIALPFQKKPMDRGNSLFIDDTFKPYPDQWAFLSSIRRMSLWEVESIIEKASRQGGVLGVRFVSTDEDEISPWLYSPSGRKPVLPITEHLPLQIDLVLGNQIYISKKNLPPALKNRLIRLAAFQNPQFYKAQAMRFPTFGKPRIAHCCEDFPKHIGLPRGCLEDTIELLRALDIEVRIQDERFKSIPIGIRFTGALRPEQEIAASAMLAYDTGVLSASAAFGKTVVAAFLIAKRRVNTLILVHRKQLMEQWIARLSSFLDVSPDHIGRIGGGKRQPKRLIDIAMIQSLCKKGVVDDVVADYGHIVVDECHHISAPSFEIVARKSVAKYVTGLSATVVRKDGHHPIIFMNCGPLRYKVDDKKQAAQRPFTHKVIARKTSFRLSHSFDLSKYSAIQEIYTALVNNDERNQMIVDDVLRAVSETRFPLILTERKEHLDKLNILLANKIEKIIIMKGGMGKKHREAAIEAIESLPYDTPKIILATGRYLGEGFDERRLDTLFLTLPISWRGILNQYAGRLHRTDDRKKEVIIYDYVDLEVPMLARMYDRRVRGYRSIGYDITP